MFNNTFLVLEVNPAHKEEKVSLNKKMSLRFSADMDPSTINRGTILLQKVNAESVECEVTYTRETRTATIKSLQPLQAGTVYHLLLLGGAKGAKSIVGGILPETKTYSFTTIQKINVSPVMNLNVTQMNGEIAVTWLQPEEYDPQDMPKYRVAISTSNLNPITAPGSVVWPVSSDAVGDIVQTSIKLARFMEPNNYYAYVQAYSSTSESDWTNHQFIVEPKVIDTPKEGPIGLTFDIMDVFPKQDSVHVTADSIKVLFTSPVDLNTINPETFYIIPKKKPKDLSIMDLMTNYSSTGSIPYTVDLNAPPNLLSVTIGTALILDNTEYTIILRESIKNQEGEALGEAYSWSFRSTYAPLFGNPELIKHDLNGLMANIPDAVIYDYMHSFSEVGLETDIRYRNVLRETVLAAPPRYLSEYVRARTSYELLIGAYLGISAKTGTSIGLGDLKVDRGDGPDLKSILSSMKDRIKRWEDALHGVNDRGYAKLGVAVRGEEVQPYPDFMERELDDIYE